MVDKTMNHVAVWMNFLKKAVNDGDMTVIGVLIAVTLVIFTVLFTKNFSKYWPFGPASLKVTVVFGVFKQRGSKRRGVLLLGSCDAGKTLLFSQLVYGKQKSTFTSMSENKGTYTIPENGKTLNVIDIPGQERVRLQMLDSHKDQARAIVFVVDSSTVQKEIKDIAEYLYTVLSDGRISSMCPSVLVACNKQDLTFAKSAAVVQGQLEKEMNTLRVTKSAALQDISTGNNNTFLGKRDRNFSFADLKPLKVDFVECSSQGKNFDANPDLTQVQQWLAKIA